MQKAPVDGAALVWRLPATTTKLYHPCTIACLRAISAVLVRVQREEWPQGKKFARRMRKRTQTTQLCASCTVPPPVASPFILQDCWVPVLRTEVSSTSS